MRKKIVITMYNNLNNQPLKTRLLSQDMAEFVYMEGFIFRTSIVSYLSYFCIILSHNILYCSFEHLRPLKTAYSLDLLNANFKYLTKFLLLCLMLRYC